MADLSTKYMGLTLPNPIIAGSSRLTSSVEQCVACENAGAGAVVLKSLFEEQIVSEINTVLKESRYQGHVEALDYLQNISEEHFLERYITLIEETKKELSIPVIPSLNCVSTGKWMEYAKNIVDAGADALELNIFLLPGDPDVEGSEYEAQYLKIIEEMRKQVKVPMAVKIGHHFTGLANMVRSIGDAGANGIVLFNRFYRPDLDIEDIKLKPTMTLSTPQEGMVTLQWIALLSEEIDLDFSASTGVHEASDVIKQILAGARSVQTCSVLFSKGIEHIRTMVNGLAEWMEKKGYTRIEDFRGLLSQEKSADPVEYERSQYIKALVGIG